MNIFVVLALAMLLIIVALRKKVPIGPAILAGGLLIWVAVKPEIPLLGEAAKQMFTMQRTYDLLFAPYFVVHVHAGGLHQSVFPDVFPSRFKLGLDEHHALCPCPQQRQHVGQYMMQRDERHVRREEIRRLFQLFRCNAANVCSPPGWNGHFTLVRA